MRWSTSWRRDEAVALAGIESRRPAPHAAAVQDDIGYALYRAQVGDKHPDAKPLKGFKGAGVLEIVENHDGDT